MAALLRRLRRNDGQGLIELIVALTILAVGIGAVLTVLTGSALSLQRSDQKGTALTLAETQLELYRNVSYAEIRLDDASWSSAPLTNPADPYFTAHSSDPTIPPGTKAGEIIDTGTDADTGVANTTCVGNAPECQAVQTVTGPDHRRYRIDTYITPSTPTADGTPTGTVVGRAVRQVTVIVRNAQLASLPILARNTSTFSKVNAAAFGGKAVPTLTLNVPKAWVTSVSGTTIPASSIGVNVSNGLYPLTPGNTSGVLTIWAIPGASWPSPPCGDATDPNWVQIGQATVDNGNATYYSNGAATIAAGNTYWWYATFTGDASNKDRTSRCSPSMTTTKVQTNPWTPSLSVTAPSSGTTGLQIAGSSITAKLTNSSPGSTGTIHIKYVQSVSAPVSCSGGTELGTASATGDGNYSESNALTPTAGTYWWWAVYDGDSNNTAKTSACGAGMPSTTVGSGPAYVSSVMKDTNGNGKIDQVVVTFDKTLGACAPCSTAGWTLGNVPSAGTLSAVTVSGMTATLTIAEGPGAANTAVGTFNIGMDSSSAIVDTLGRHGSFSAAAPSDGAGPVPISMSSTNKVGGTAGRAEAGDKVTVTFSEPIATIGGATTSLVTLATTNGNGKPVTMTMTNLGNGSGFAIGNKNNYLTGNSANAVFGTAASTLAIAGATSNQVTVTLGTLSGAPSLSNGSYVAGTTTAFTPAATIKDAAGNAAAGTLIPTITFF